MGNQTEHMVKLTLISRVADGLPLAEGLDINNDLDPYKQQAKVRALLLGDSSVHSDTRSPVAPLTA